MNSYLLAEAAKKFLEWVDLDIQKQKKCQSVFAYVKFLESDTLCLTALIETFNVTNFLSTLNANNTNIFLGQMNSSDANNSAVYAILCLGV